MEMLTPVLGVVFATLILIVLFQFVVILNLYAQLRSKHTYYRNAAHHHFVNTYDTPSLTEEVEELEEVEEIVEASDNYKDLLEFIHSNLRHGYSSAQIKQHLLAHGYTQKDISKAYLALTKHLAKTK